MGGGERVEELFWIKSMAMQSRCKGGHANRAVRGVSDRPKSNRHKWNRLKVAAAYLRAQAIRNSALKIKMRLRMSQDDELA